MNLKPLNLAKSDFDEMASCMAVGNTALKECAEMLGMEQVKFRQQLFRDKLNLNELPPEQAEKIRAAIPLIQAVRDKCEDKLQRGFMRWVTKQAKNISHHAADQHHAFEELQAVGMWAIWDATFTYTDTSIKIKSFIWRVVRRRMLAAYNKLNPFCPLTNEAIKLRKLFEQKKAEYNERVTEQQVVEDMDLSPREQQVLFRSMTQMLNQPHRSDDDEASMGDDYTAGRRGIDNDFRELFSKSEVRQAVKNANLSPIEIETYLTSLYPYYGWQEAIAAKYVNPKTNQRFTRQYISLIAQRVQDKIKSVYLDPPKVNVENPEVDKWFDEMNGENV